MTLHYIVICSLILAGICFAIVIFDILVLGNKQHMMIMNFVYPITMLYSGPIGLWFYYTIGRKSTHKAVMEAKNKGEKPPNKKKPFWQSVCVGVLHCGSGCTLGDIIAETTLIFVPVVIFGHEVFGAWMVDYILALIIGILFQYYSIKPMKGLSVKEGLKQAIKADTLSLTCWQIGMYGWMAIAIWLIFDHKLHASKPLFWFMMQIAMFFGFMTAFPINWWLIKKGIKEEM